MDEKVWGSTHIPFPMVAKQKGGRLELKGLIEVYAYQYKIIWDISKQIKQYWKQIQLNDTYIIQQRM